MALSLPSNASAGAYIPQTHPYSMFDPATISLERLPNGVRVCTFNRPDARNALNRRMVEEIRMLLKLVADDEESRALVFAGSDRAFVSGADISELVSRNKHDALAFINTGLFNDIENFVLPTVAAVRGWALGGGCELAAACDLRVAGRGARFGQPEVKLGILPGAGATYRLPKLIGLGRAKDLVLTGRIVEASEAFEIGLVDRLVDDEEVLTQAIDLAAEIGANSPLAVRLSRMALNASSESSTHVGMLFEATAQAVAFEDDEKRRRMTAFLEDRGKRSRQ